MELLPEEVRKQLPPLHTQDNFPDDQLYAYARLTVKALGMTFFLLELHTDQDTFSGYLIDPRQEQFGYFSFDYLDEQLGSFPLEYDQHFPPKPLAEAVRAERRVRHAHGEGLPTDSSLASHRPYYYATAYTRNATAVYQAIRAIIHREPVNLSAFHVPPTVLPNFWHIVVMGDRPSEPVHEQIMNALSGGTLTTIPYDLLMQLFARKVEENQKGSWREHHTGIRLKRKPNRPKGKRDPRHRGNKGKS